MDVDSTSTVWAGGNTPVRDEKGRRVWVAECWRIPSVPFSRPRCCGHRTRRIGWNQYRCVKCAARLTPERLHHRLLLKRNPFGATRGRDLVRVRRWTHRGGSRWT